MHGRNIASLPRQPAVQQQSSSRHMAEHSTSRIFSKIAQWTAQQCGRASTFIVACIIIIVWAVTGPVFDYSDTWQLIINTGTTIVTFLMVFLMQNTQNRDTVSIQLKLDELIRAQRERAQRDAVAGRSHRGTAQARQGHVCESCRRGGAGAARARASQRTLGRGQSRRLEKPKRRCWTRSMPRRRHHPLTTMRSSRDRFSP